MELLVDPSTAFCVGCVLLPLAIDPSITADDVIAHLCHPANLACLALLIATVVWTTRGGRCVKLVWADRAKARWYLLNGVVVHILLDGLAGVYKVNPYFAKSYAKIDAGFAAPLGDFRGSALHVVSLLELVVKGPVCLLLYVAYHRGHPARDVLEFFTCVTQVYGTIVWLGQAAITGGGNMDVDWGLTFSLHYVVHFWFAVVFGCILYCVVPGVLGWQTAQRIMRACGRPAPPKCW